MKQPEIKEANCSRVFSIWKFSQKIHIMHQISEMQLSCIVKGTTEFWDTETQGFADTAIESMQ